jgi:hypothetical protein
MQVIRAKGDDEVKLRRGFGQLSHMDMLIIRELLADLAGGPQLPLLDGEAIGHRRFTLDEERAIRALNIELSRTTAELPR